MPNHCENDLHISGSDEAVAEALRLIGADQTPPKFDFSVFIPYPEPWATMDAEHRAIEEAGRAAGMTAIGGEWPAHDHPEFDAIRAAFWKASRDVQQPLMSAYEAKWHTRSDGFNSGGYEWCCNNWGTKWNAYDVARRDYDGRVIVTFQTAWAPPLPVIKALAERCPDCTFTLEYFEQGMEYAGGVTYYGESDHWDDEPWKAGTPSREWEIKGYRGRRGG